MGAGASEISAGFMLNDQFKVLILEARDRIGGRINEKYIMDISKLPLGAAWLHDKGNDKILNSLLDLCNVKYENVDNLENNNTMKLFKRDGSVSENQNKKFIDILSNLIPELKNLQKKRSKYFIGTGCEDYSKEK